MRKFAWATALFALGLLALPATHQPASALPAIESAASGKSLVGEVGQRKWHKGNRGWREGRRVHRGPAIRFGFVARGRCAWLRHKAARTGSAYWWRRYRQCRY